MKDSRFWPLMEEILAKSENTIEEIRAQVLRGVTFSIEEFTKRVRDYERMERALGGLGLKQAYACYMISRLRPKILWWNEIKTAIESRDPERVMAAMERLIRHHKPDKFFLTWIAPGGFALLGGALLSGEIKNAEALRDHYNEMTVI